MSSSTRASRWRLLVGDHEAHDAAHTRLRGRALGLSGHAAFATFSVLTRLPPPGSRSPETVSRLIAASFPRALFLGAREHADLSARVGGLRALPTYRALEVDVELLD